MSEAVLTHGDGAAPPLENRDFAAIAAIMQADARIHLSDIKRTLVHGRLVRRLRQHGLASFRDYVALVEADKAERAEMVTALTTNHTFFFRENHHFDHFRETTLPTLKAANGLRPIRIWSAGSSSGEEVYSIAMCMLGTDPSEATWMRRGDVRLLATDISPPMIEIVRGGLYPADAADSIPQPYRRLWTRAVGNQIEMAPPVRAAVTARPLNLFDAWPMRQQYDAIFCRNVMIYFDDAAKAELQQRLVAQLAVGGYLYIGHSERLIGPAAAGMHSCGHTIYRKGAA
jgi:chemotaxis protein methyltransferase CheR